jgi:acyl dehydratase
MEPHPSPSFAHYPGLRGRESEARALAEQVRRLIRLSVSTAPPAEETAALTAELAAVADRLERHLPEVPWPRFLGPADDQTGTGRPLEGTMPFDLIVGGFNPLALPVEMSFDPPRALGHAVFDAAYEGAPGCVHGAVLVATFDMVFTGANALADATGPTVRLSARYRRPTLLGERTVFEGWVTEVTERRVFCQGRVVQGDVVTVEAEGEFAILDRAGVQAMASGRRASFDAAPTGAPEADPELAP